MLEQLTEYYGIDLLAMVFTFLGIYLLGDKKKHGFTVHTVGNVLWLIVGILTGSMGLLIANFIFAIMNVRGYLRWKKETSE